MKKTTIYLFVLLAVSALKVHSKMNPPGRVISPAIQLKFEYPFIKYDLNKLQFYGQRQGWDSLFSRFEKLSLEGTGHISIVHFGGSHVQGGFLTDRLRENFNRLTDGTQGERGFVFPYRLAGTNSPASMKCEWTGKWTACRSALSSHSCQWGVSGITAFTTDTLCQVKIWSPGSDSANSTFDYAYVFSEPSATQYELSVAGTQKSEWLRPGISRHTFHSSRDTLQLAVKKTDSSQTGFALQGVYLGNSRLRNGITYNAIGSNGAGTASYLRCRSFTEQLAALEPHLVILAIGVNDANVPANEFDARAFELRYDSLIHQIRQASPGAQFLFVTNNDTYYNRKRPNSNAKAVKTAMINLATRHNAAVYDIFNIMGGLGSIKQWQDAGLAQRDKIHFTRQGYELIADMLYLAFTDAFGNYLDRHEPQ